MAQANWKQGDTVNVGALKGLRVTGIKEQGSLIQYILKDELSQKEYTFVPGGLRKTSEPAATVINPATARHTINKVQGIVDKHMSAIREEVGEVLKGMSVAPPLDGGQPQNTPQPLQV